jgi:hypothetical protein
MTKKEQLIEQIVSMESIYLGGCLWGVQEFLKQLPGVLVPKLAELMDEIH